MTYIARHASLLAADSTLLSPTDRTHQTLPQNNGVGEWGRASPAEPLEPAKQPKARLHHYFEASCDATPGATALEGDDLQLSYAELDARANQLAHYLIEQGVAPYVRVGILLNRSVHTYVTLLAVLKAGGTFVPIDPTSPPDRVEYTTTDSTVDLLVTTSDLAGAAASTRCPVLCMDEAQRTLSTFPTTRPDDVDEGDLTAAYIIYTSGSSGRPKGVEVAQHSICNFINVVPSLYRVGPTDRIYQGMTIAFDFSIEEIWPTWAVGATLVAGPTDGRRFGAELGDFLEKYEVTVLYCVPTVLATIDRDLPLVHTLNLGGEACPQELVERWGTGDRVILNTYGPTETTVTAIMARLQPGQPVTIGYPLPTYQSYLLDESLTPVDDGMTGEICIGGPGVAIGYVGRPKLTAEKFIPDPFTRRGRLYRTGDLGRSTPYGIEFLGRADSEVKVRGHRVDLGEIENLLREDDLVSDAVTTLVPSTKELASYITRNAGEPDEALIYRLYESLRTTVPPYMVPAYLTIMDALPMLPSGKVDRGTLPAPTPGSRLIRRTEMYVAPGTPAERGICESVANALGLDFDDVSIDADFFTDLGGHSLAAASVVSTLRRHQVGRRLAIGDLYANPTIRSLAQHLEVAQDSGAPGLPTAPPRRYSGFRVAVAGAAQLGMLYLLLLVLAAPIAVVYSQHRGVPSREVMLQLMSLVPLTFLVGRWVLPVIGVRLMSLRLRPGTFPLWGAVHLRVWAIQKLLELSPSQVLSGSPLFSPYLRLLGARVGSGCHIATGELGLPRFLTIGSGASVGYGVQLEMSFTQRGWLTIAPVVIGENAFVGASSMLTAGGQIGAGAALGEHSALGHNQVIPAGERWAGSPSLPAPEAGPVFEAMASGEAPRAWSRALLTGFCLGLVALELLPFVAIIPVMLLVWWVLLTQGIGAGFAVTALAGPVYVLIVCLAIVSVQALVPGRTPTGIHVLRSPLGLRKWFLDKLFEMSLLLTNSLYATLYTVPWLRLLGAKIDKGCEVSTVAHIDPELVVLQSQSFVADMAQVGSAVYHNGLIAQDKTEIGHRAFVGNAAFIPAGTTLGDGSLVGVHTVPPPEGVPAGTSWLGSPAIYLPKRQESWSFAAELTFSPTRARVLERYGIEFLRIAMPGSLLAASAYIALYLLAGVATGANPWVVVTAAPAAFLVMGLAIVILVAGIKWLLVGTYVPRVEPLWGRFVRRSELVTGLYEAAAVPALLQGLTGTPLLGPLLRLFGTHVGQRTLIESTYFTEFDLVHIGDDAAIGKDVSLQTHLFEDRVMKMSAVSIERGASVGARSVVLYDAVLGRDSTLGPLSLVMKGESLMPDTDWAGIPAEFGQG